MVESSDDPSLLEPSPTKAHVSKFRRFGADRRPTLPLTNPSSVNDAHQRDGYAAGSSHCRTSDPTGNDVADDTSSALPPPAPPPASEEPHGEAPPTIESGKKPNVMVRFYNTSKQILLSSYIHILLVFVPIGIAINFANVSPTVVFAMNAIAIIPLAKLLCYATDSVATTMGDTIGALMNITFGNAVELIIFMYVKLTKLKTIDSWRLPFGASNLIASHSVPPLHIALSKNEIRIVQASLLGSILANLLLILGMCFLCGGLRFQEQIYNATVTQMSACLLSLSVMSLLLPVCSYFDCESQIYVLLY
ncbi:hypothetical protein MMC30_005937 [Trapelia coarctata]|nr:hypothetical protein [Trapelia coarctata]